MGEARPSKNPYFNTATSIPLPKKAAKSGGIIVAFWGAAIAPLPSRLEQNYYNYYIEVWFEAVERKVTAPPSNPAIDPVINPVIWLGRSPTFHPIF